MIEQAKFTYSPIRKIFVRKFEKHGEKHVEALQILKPPEQQKPKSIEDIFSKESCKIIELKKNQMKSK